MNSIENMVCDECGKELHTGFEMTSVTSSDNSADRTLCLECYNREMADHGGLDLEIPQFPPMKISDFEEREHTFSFATRLFGNQVSIEAHEVNRDFGYQFQVLGKPDDVQNLFQKLVRKIKRALTYQHLIERNGHLSISDGQIIRGRFECDDDENSYFPAFVVDGKKLKWEELGQLLNCFEGWQFRLQIFDPSEEA